MVIGLHGDEGLETRFQFRIKELCVELAGDEGHGLGRETGLLVVWVG